MLTLLCVVVPLCLSAQTDTSGQHKRPQKRVKTPANSTKLELVYKGFYGSNGNRSFFVTVPFLRVNDNRPIALNTNATLLRRYYVKAPLANLELDNMQRETRTGRAIFWGGTVTGFAVAMTGVFAKEEFGKHTKFYVRSGIGSALILGSGMLRYMYARRADGRLRKSMDIYNDRYYKPIQQDTLSPVSVAQANRELDSILPKNPSDPSYASAPKMYEETFEYSVLRNDPANSNLWGVSFNIISPEFYALNSAFTGGIGAFYTYRSSFGISVDYNRGYFDLIQGSHKNDRPDDYYAAGYAIPAKYKRVEILDLQTKFTLAKWDREGSYHVGLGHERMAGQTVKKLGRIPGMTKRAIMGRLGYSLSNRLVQSNNGLDIRTTTPPYTFTDNGKEYTLRPGDLDASPSMLHMGMVNAGASYSVFGDMKVDFKGEDRKGRSEIRSQTDYYAELLYAPTIRYQDLTYFHGISETREIIPQRLDISNSPYKKLGFRIGIESKNMGRIFGTRYGIEMGLRPGPATAVKSDNFYAKLMFAIVVVGKSNS
jgi:hypothetical protein